MTVSFILELISIFLMCKVIGYQQIAVTVTISEITHIAAICELGLDCQLRQSISAVLCYDTQADTMQFDNLTIL